MIGPFYYVMLWTETWLLYWFYVMVRLLVGFFMVGLVWASQAHRPIPEFGFIKMCYLVICSEFIWLRIRVWRLGWVMGVVLDPRWTWDAHYDKDLVQVVPLFFTNSSKWTKSIRKKLSTRRKKINDIYIFSIQIGFKIVWKWVWIERGKYRILFYKYARHPKISPN